MEVTQELLHKLFEYRDGELYWKVSRGRLAKVGDKAGWISKKGYLNTKINGKCYLNHRLIFLMHYGYLPEMLDHKDTNTLNNRIENLREATRSQNNRNVKLRKDNTSGIKGVSWFKKSKKWLAQVTINKKQVYLGLYEDLELAELVATEARNKYHGEFANHGKQDEKVST